jgi:hypothetical protein
MKAHSEREEKMEKERNKWPNQFFHGGHVYDLDCEFDVLTRVNQNRSNILLSQ